MYLNQRILSIEVTQRCNNACRHCYNFWRENGQEDRAVDQNLLSKEEIIEIVRKVRRETPLEVVALSGGEPFMRKDLPAIASDLAEMGLETVIVTNGSFLTESMLRRMPRGVHFEVTLLGYTAARHDSIAGVKVFDRLIRNLALIERFGSAWTMVFVATRMNALDVGRTVEMGIALGASAVLYNRVNLGRGSRPYAGEIVPPVDMLRESLRQLQDAVRRYGIEAVCAVPIPPCILDLDEFPDLSFGWCPRGGENAYYTVGSNGFLRPCNHSSMILGDLRVQGFGELVSGPESKRLWNALPKECQECSHPLKDQCLGGCPAASDEFYGTPMRMDPFCEFAGGELVHHSSATGDPAPSR